MIFFLNTLNYSEQVELIKSLRVIILEYPFFSPTTPRFNKPFKIKTTNAGKWGWTSDVTGYKYIRKHPVTKMSWAKIPHNLLSIWKKFTDSKSLPDSCLINLYNYPDSSLGVHQDKDEKNFQHPILSISLGSDCIFKFGKNKNKLNKINLKSGSIAILKGDSRLYYHGVPKIIKTDKNIFNKLKYNCFPDDCRINITLRKYEL